MTLASPARTTAPVPPALARERIDAALSRVEKPARYTGAEWNSVAKDWATCGLRWCFAYPDLYEIGMSNLGLKILYEILNDRDGTLAERCFAPWVDLQAELLSRGLPLWSLETRRPLAAFDVLGISLGYELVATNLLSMLHLGGVGLSTVERAPGEPLVIAGGTTTLNPEPLAEILDAVVLGEGEDVIVEVSAALETVGWTDRWVDDDGLLRRGATRADALRALAAIPGVYVPSLYRPVYHGDGRIERIERHDPSVPARVTRRIVADFETAVRGIRQVVPNIPVVFDRAQIEVMRGCTRGCRFCQAGMQFRPLRERPAAIAIEAADAILAATGYEEISLTSLSTADYTDVREVALAIRDHNPGVHVSIPSTRVDAFTVDLTDALAPTRRSSFTFAPEAGSQRLRDAINKGVTDDEIARCAELAFSRGWSTLKFYFMIGLPGETMDDVLGIAAICRRVLAIGRRHHGDRAQVKANVSTFIPKPLTPFLWDGQDPMPVIGEKIAALQRALRGRGLDLSWHDAESAVLEAALSRGDRRLGRVIRRAWETGARFDAWNDHFRFDLWMEAFAAEGLDPAWYAQRDIPLDETLPWAHLDGGVADAFLQKEWRRSREEKTIPDCHWDACYACGVPDATGFACSTGEQGPRSVMVTLEPLRPGTDDPRVRRRWTYTGPPGDRRREGAAGQAEQAEQAG